MSAAAPSPLDALAFRFPQRVGDCTCPICTRWNDASANTDYPSPFGLYRLEKYDPAEASQFRAPSEEERAAFNVAYPAMVFTRAESDYATNPSAKAQPLMWVKVCIKLIRRLQKEKMAASFLAPVDPVKLNIPDYLTLIKHPMDLGTVEKKLLATEAKHQSTPAQAAEVDEATVYAAPEEFASDVRMIWRNSFLCQHKQIHHAHTINCMQC